jgi:hypothetical protein
MPPRDQESSVRDPQRGASVQDENGTALEVEKGGDLVRGERAHWDVATLLAGAHLAVD